MDPATAAGPKYLSISEWSIGVVVVVNVRRENKRVRTAPRLNEAIRIDASVRSDKNRFRISGDSAQLAELLRVTRLDRHRNQAICTTLTNKNTHANSK